MYMKTVQRTIRVLVLWIALTGLSVGSRIETATAQRCVPTTAGHKHACCAVTPTSCKYAHSVTKTGDSQSLARTGCTDTSCTCLAPPMRNSSVPARFLKSTFFSVPAMFAGTASIFVNPPSVTNHKAGQDSSLASACFYSPTSPRAPPFQG